MKKTFLLYLLWFSVFLGLVGLALIAFGGDWRLWGLLSLMGGILGALTYAVLNYDEVHHFLFEYGTRQWLTLVLFIFLLLGVVILIQAIANRHNIRFDLTPHHGMSLSASSEKIMEQIKTPVRVTAFYQRVQKREMMNVLDPFAVATSKFTYHLYDLDRNPALAKRFSVSNYGTVVIEMHGKYKVLSAASEESIVNAILTLNNPQRKTIYFLAGHGERALKEPDSLDGSSSELLKETLETENFIVKDLLLLSKPVVPADAALVIINGPRGNFTPGDLSVLEGYLKQGGMIILTVDPGPDYDLAALLKPYDIRLGNDVIVDPVNYLMDKGSLVPIIQNYLDHDITEKFTIPTVFPMVRSLVKGNIELPGISVTTFALSSDRSWAEKDIALAEKGDFRYDPGADQKGPVPLAVIVEGADQTDESKKTPVAPMKGRLVVFGSSEFIANQYITLAGNRDFFMNTVRYLTEDTPLIVIKKSLSQSEKAPLILSPVHARMIFVSLVILQPALILAIGIVVAWRRRQKS
jgi:ABC-type uncharacterized transport system involved in gliding motility auxiliary subunit